MSSMAVDGMISGLKTSDLINQLMQVEAMPQTMLKQKVSTTQAFITALQGLNTRVASLVDVAKAAAKPESWQVTTGTSSATSVKVTTSAGSQPSSLSFSVDRLAKAQTSVSANVTSLESYFGGSVPESLTIVSGPDDKQTFTSVDLAGVTDLAGLATKLNAAGTGVTATVVKVSGEESRLQLTGKSTGEDAAFDVYRGAVTQSDLDLPASPPGVPGDPSAGTRPTAVVDRAGALVSSQDAQITLWGNQTVTSASNTFGDVITGVSFTVSAVEAEPVTLTTTRNDAAIKKLASDLVGSMGVVLSEITSRTATTTTTSADGRTVITGGVLSGDSATRGVQQSVTTAMSLPIDGISPAEVGIVLGRDGTFTFDEAKFTAAMSEDPAKVQRVVTGIGERVVTAATSISDPIDGSLTLKVKSQESFSKGLTEQVSDWDRRLETRRAGLQRTYASLEVTLSGLQSQSSWLAGQVAGLPKWS